MLYYIYNVNCWCILCCLLLVYVMLLYFTFLYIDYSQVQSLLERFWEQLLQMSRNHLTNCQSGNLESLYMVLVTTVERVRILCNSKSEPVTKEATAAYRLLEQL